jgi:hypothetical protein
MKIFFASFVVIFAAAITRATTFTNSASADSFVRSNAPTLNYGGAGALSVSGTGAVNVSGVTNGAFDSFIRFNTFLLASNFNALYGTNNWSVTGAKLRVTEIGAPAQTLFNRGVGAFEIRWIANDNWIEGTGNPGTPTNNGIAFTNESALLNPTTDKTLGVFTNAGADGVLSFPLALPAAFVSDVQAGGEVGIFLTAIDPGIGFTFDSRSFNTTNARPFLEISALPRPGIVSASLSGTNFILSATNGAAGGIYFAFASTNLLLPLNQWTPVATNVLNAAGNFSIIVTNAAGAVSPSQQFFILQAQ